MSSLGKRLGLRDRVAMWAVAVSIHYLPTGETSEYLKTALAKGFAVQNLTTVARILAEEQERQNRPNT